MSEWQKVGTIPVDGGHVVVGDPCYVRGVIGDWRAGIKGPGDYSENGVELCGDGIGGALAIILPAGFGDGGYDVFVKRTPRTNHIAEMRVVFVEDGKDICEAPGCECGWIHGRGDATEPYWAKQEKCARCNGTGES